MFEGSPTCTHGLKLQPVGLDFMLHGIEMLYVLGVGAINQPLLDWLRDGDASLCCLLLFTTTTTKGVALRLWRVTMDAVSSWGQV